MNDFFIKIGGRKFLAYIVGVAVTIYMFERGLSVFKTVSQEMILSLIKENHTHILLLTSVYLGINLIQKFKTTFTNDKPQH